MDAVHPLGELISQRMKDEGWSLDDVVERAVARGEKLGRSNLHRMQYEPPESLTRSTVLGLAAGLGVTPLSVANKALESMGINPRPTETTDTLATVQIDPTLTEANRAQLRALIMEMRSTSERVIGARGLRRNNAQRRRATK